MKAVVSIVVVLTCLMFLSESVIACSCIVNPLSKRFRWAEAIFIGQVADAEDLSPATVQNYSRGLPVLEVSKSWKGVRKKYIAVDFDIEHAEPACPSLYKFEKGKDYLVFAYEDDLKVQMSCSDTKIVGGGFTTDEIRRLDNFWFRIRARLWPF